MPQPEKTARRPRMQAILERIPPRLRQKRLAIAIAWGVLALLAISSFFTDHLLDGISKDTQRDAFEAYARKLAATSRHGQLAFKGIDRMDDAHHPGYKLTYVSQGDALNAVALDKSSDDQAWRESKALALAWKIKFCSQELLELMKQQRIYQVQGAIEDQKGEAQQLAQCTANPYASSSLPPPSR